MKTLIIFVLRGIIRVERWMWLNFHVKGRVLGWYYANRAAKIQASLDMLAERREAARVHPYPNVNNGEIACRRALLDGFNVRRAVDVPELNYEKMSGE